MKENIITILSRKIRKHLHDLNVSDKTFIFVSKFGSTSFDRTHDKRISIIKRF